ncbi:MAG: metallophosphoesterase [Bacilli bacterium]|jgi:UDP-2,3-diacylglucosamine pyrophosphatase LpxH
MKNKSNPTKKTGNASQSIKKPTLAFMGCMLLAASLTSLAGCGANKAAPLWEAGASRNKTVVISDLHLGIDDRYSETIINRPYLIEFLKRLQQTSDVRELVIAGDFLDEWYLPVYFSSYSDSNKFYRDCIANNQEVIDEMKNVISSGIKLVYVAGNHDLLLESTVLDEAIPGIIQARDAKGLGAYYTGGRNEIVIEHGHRYDVFSAPDTETNAELCGNNNTMLPSGYFYARYGATWVLEGSPIVEKNLPTVTKPDESDTDQYGAYLYYQVMKRVTEHLTPNEALDAKIFDMHIAGFNDSYSFLDFYPAEQEGGTISAPVLFRNIQRTWEKRQEVNQVKVTNSFIEAVAGTTDSNYFYSQARRQYLENPNENVDVVVFGHTHAPRYDVMDNGKCYANSGTWIDHNNVIEAAIRTFTVIESGEDDKVALKKMMEDGSIADITAIYSGVNK